MTETPRNTPPGKPQSKGARRPWTKPTMTAYGPIGKLTQGGSGGKNDGTSGKKH